jgi:hypothetical protein
VRVLRPRPADLHHLVHVYLAKRKTTAMKELELGTPIYSAH